MRQVGVLRVDTLAEMFGKRMALFEARAKEELALIRSLLARRGASVLLLEKNDYGGGTSGVVTGQREASVNLRIALPK